MKKNDYLKYIGYEITQDEGMFKSNSDTVILGMSLDSLKNKTVLDIGTNNGALLLYALDKGASHLYGVDVFERAIQTARMNLQRYTENFDLFVSRVQDLQMEKVDAIVCNPPFFEMNNVTQDEYLKKAMFEESLPLEDLFSSFRRLMKENGEIYLIYDASRFPEVYEMCLKYKLKIMKMRFVHDKKSSYALRVVLKLKIGKMSKVRILQPVMIENGNFEIMEE